MTGTADPPWSVPVTVDEVPDTGCHIALTADAQARAALARLAGLAALPQLEASFELTRRGRGGLRVVGRVSATVGQTCVVTLDPVENEIDEAVDLLFLPLDELPAVGRDGGDVEVPVEDAPEPLVGGHIDLGAIATEFLMLAIDPYPRKPGAVFHSPVAGDGSGHPFAPLAAFKQKQGGKHR